MPVACPESVFSQFGKLFGRIFLNFLRTGRETLVIRANFYYNGSIGIL